MTATNWENDMNPTGWYFIVTIVTKNRFMTEKFDGVRLYWNGSSFYTRQGKRVKVPETVTSQLPDIPLDGELWFVVFKFIV
jgi:DNA ligase-1